MLKFYGDSMSTTRTECDVNGRIINNYNVERGSSDFPRLASNSVVRGGYRTDSNYT